MLRWQDNPPALPPTVEMPAQLAGRWAVAHTKPRHEKALAHDLLARGVGYFLPMVESVRFSGGRKRRVLKPLFSSYLFLCGSSADRTAALRTNRVCRMLEVHDQQELVKELTAVCVALRSSACVHPCALLAPGRRCRVRAGPLAGLEGTVIRHSKKTRLVLQVSFIGQGAAVEIDADALEPVE